jgi:hypothetical protein
MLLVQLSQHISEEKHWQTVWLKASCFEQNSVAGFSTANCLKKSILRRFLLKQLPVYEQVV